MVDWGRTHSRRFYDPYEVILKNDLKRVNLGKAAREDLDWWLKFCATFNGKRKIEYARGVPHPLFFFLNLYYAGGSRPKPVFRQIECTFNTVCFISILQTYIYRYKYI